MKKKCADMIQHLHDNCAIEQEYEMKSLLGCVFMWLPFRPKVSKELWFFLKCVFAYYRFSQLQTYAGDVFMILCLFLIARFYPFFF